MKLSQKQMSDVNNLDINFKLRDYMEIVKHYQ